MELYDYFRSSASFRVRIALNYKNLDYERIAINLSDDEQKSENYLAINPAGLVPTLVDNVNSIHQSLAIIEYLNEKYPLQPSLLPDNLVARAYVRELACTVACDIHPLNNLKVLKYITNNLNHNEDEKIQWYKHWINQGLSTLEKLINTKKFYEGKYCYKDHFSMADICLIPQLYNAKRFKCNVDRYPTLLAIEAECLKLDAVIKAHPESA